MERNRQLFKMYVRFTRFDWKCDMQCAVIIEKFCSFPETRFIILINTSVSYSVYSILILIYRIRKIETNVFQCAFWVIKIILLQFINLGKRYLLTLCWTTKLLHFEDTKNLLINYYWMISRIIQTEVNVFCRSEAAIRKPNSITVLLFTSTNWNIIQIYQCKTFSKPSLICPCQSVCR